MFLNLYSWWYSILMESQLFINSFLINLLMKRLLFADHAKSVWRHVPTIILAILLFSVTFDGAAQIQTRVTQETAFTTVKRFFFNKDYDYYSIESSNDSQISSSNWNFFVDPSPLAGWEHECYIVSVPRSVDMGVTPAASAIVRMLPPDETLKPLQVKDFYGDRKHDIPKLPIKTTSGYPNANEAGKTYAIILSGGINITTNYYRYWNDCSFIYQTLTRTYRIPKGNIYPIMADGDNPAYDYKDQSGVYKSSNPDLDGDGVNDLKLAATRANIKSALTEISSKVNKGDHVFLFVIDHGGKDDNKGLSYIHLWQYERLYDYELADWISPILNKEVYFNAVFGQCYSGGFVDNLERIGCTVAAASLPSESSYACPDIPYDEFVYQWTSAINGEDAYGNKVSADLNNDGRISMEEAFLSAKEWDRITDEHPVYSSTPEIVGKSLAFDKIPVWTNLYIADNIMDEGQEPNLTTDCVWNSPSIWVRNKDDGSSVHQDPYYSSDHTTATVYVRVSNRGIIDYTGGCTLKLYWGKASTNFDESVWTGANTYNGAKTGGLIGTVAIKPIKAGYTDLLKMTWNLPADLKDIDEKMTSHQYTLYAVITGEDSSNSNDKFNPKQSSSAAQRSLSVLHAASESYTVKYYIRNLEASSNYYDLHLVPKGSKEANLMENGKIYFILSAPIYNGWITGGSKQTSFTKDTSRLYTYLTTGSSAQLDQIYLRGNTTGELSVGAIFPTPSIGTKSETYTFDLIQKVSSTGEIVGGETLTVKSPGLSSSVLNINSEYTEDGGVRLSVADENSHNAVWLCGDEYIGTGEEVTVDLSSSEKVYNVMIPDGEDTVAVGTITLASGLKNSRLSEDGSYIEAEFHSVIDTDEVNVVISQVRDYGASSTIETLTTEDGVLRVDIRDLSAGVYQIAFIHKNTVIGSMKFQKQ